MDNSWKPVFLENADEIVSLSEKLDNMNAEVYPTPDKAFRAFKLCPYDKVKVVIIGQDPYPSELASGLAFSVDPGHDIPASMKTIHKMVEHNGYKVDPKSGNLEHWAKQGVLLLNVALSVEKNKPKSHLRLWQNFFKIVISELHKKDHLVWMTWGSVPSQNLFRHELKGAHMYLELPHPSPASPNSNKFTKKTSLIETNEYLKNHKLTPIDWRII